MSARSPSPARVLLPYAVTSLVLGALVGLLLNVFDASGGVAGIVCVGFFCLCGVLGAHAAERTPDPPTASSP